MLSTPKGINKRQLPVEKSTVVTSGDILIRQAFDNSLQANIISIAHTGKILVANSAACKLLGYSNKEIQTKAGSSIFNTTESSFKKMLNQRNKKGHASAYVSVIKKSGKTVYCEITSAVFTDEQGIEKAITTITDATQNRLNQKNIDTLKDKVVAQNIRLARSKQKNIDARNDKIVESNIALAKSRQVKIDMRKEKIVANNIIQALERADDRLDDNNDWIRHIAKVSYDVMWDWNIRTGEIYVGDSIEEVFGYKTGNNSTDFKNFTRCLVPEEKGRIEQKLLKTLASRKKTWSDSYKLKCSDGSVAFTNNRASIIRDENGKAIRLIGATQDVSRLQELEKKLDSQVIIRDEFNKIFTEAARLSFEGIWEWNLITDKFILGEGFNKLFGYNLKNNTGNIMADWGSYLHPADKKIIEKDLHAAIASTSLHWEQAYRFIRADGSIANVFSRASIIRDAGGKALRMIGVMQDVSKLRRLEEKLEQEMNLKTTQIAEAKEDARDSERSGIGRELHDNVNQLLGASKMYLEMGKKGGENSQMYLNKSSDYTLSAIEEIRKLTKGLITDIIKNFGLFHAIENISNDTMEVNPIRIKCGFKGFTENSVNDKFKLNIFRIVQEQLNNVLKHSRATRVIIKISQNDKSIMLSIADNGIGFDILKKRNGIGLANIKSRTLAYNGIADLVSQVDKGCTLYATFPLADVLL